MADFPFSCHFREGGRGRGQPLHGATGEPASQASGKKHKGSRPSSDGMVTWLSHCLSCWGQTGPRGAPSPVLGRHPPQTQQQGHLASSPYLPLAPLPGSSLSRSQGCPHQEYLLTRLALLAALTTNMLSDKVGRKKSSRAGNNVRNHPLPPPTEGEVGPASRSHNQLLGEASVALSHFSPSCFTSQHRACCQGPRAGDGSTRALGLGPQRAWPRGRGVGSGPLFPPPGALSGASGGRGQAASHLCFSLGRLTSLSSCPPARPPSVHMGFNVFITCLTRCLIASPLNGAVTVETRNKRPPENEMIKQVTLAKQTQPRNLWGLGRAGFSSPTHGWKAWTRLGTNVPVPELGQNQGAPPAGQCGTWPIPSSGSRISQAALLAGLGPCALGLKGWRGGRHRPRGDKDHRQGGDTLPGDIKL